jgi:hypothetical protein
MNDQHKIFPIGVMAQKDAYKISNFTDQEQRNRAWDYWREKGTLEGFETPVQDWRCPFCNDTRYFEISRTRQCTGCHRDSVVLMASANAVKIITKEDL